MAWLANPERYEQMLYRYCGKSGLRLPSAIAGFVAQFRPRSGAGSQRALLRKAFDSDHPF